MLEYIRKHQKQEDMLEWIDNEGRWEGNEAGKKFYRENLGAFTELYLTKGEHREHSSELTKAARNHTRSS